eukprot:TRINITY_DN81613_c0_g1_i1.p1 TRINITY_DN81613_c0_g1~~TRINITY_DN81613_c0_g1_i1.p1  ORF type:complete len:971 (-),score=219.79 TRINITY_DN81613_c0_g1_i1:31-2904(-)
MGNKASALPDGPAGKALQEMITTRRIPITDSFWFELLKVQLPGLLKTGFFDSLYSEPAVLDGLVRDAYFLQLVATNEHSGNFRTFLRFWARLLHYYRTSPCDAKPCTLSAVLSLSLLCRCLLKQFAECFTAQELIFQLEQVPPHEDEPGEAAEPSCEDGGIPVTYRGHRIVVKASELAADPAAAAVLFIEPFCQQFPEDSGFLRDIDTCTLRTLATGESFAVAEAAERIAEAGIQELVLCPAALPRARGSVLRGVFRELVDFVVCSSFGAVSGASPSLHSNRDVDSGQAMPRNVTMAPSIMRLQGVLHEILLLLAAVVAPRFTAPSLDAEDGKQDLSSASRSDFSAPYLFVANERRSAASAAKLRAKAAAAEAAGQKMAVSTEPRAEKDEEATPGVDLHSPFVAKAPAPGETVQLPFLAALLEVLEEEDVDNDVEANGAMPNGAANGSTTEASTPNGHGMRQGVRTEALLASLLNCAWLEPYSALLPSPPKEVLRLLESVPLQAAPAAAAPDNDVSKMYLGSTELMPGLPSGYLTAGVEESGAAASEALSAGRCLAKRALLVLFLLLFHQPEVHPMVSSAFASLTDPQMEGTETKPAYIAVAAPVNFPKLLRCMLTGLQESAHALLLYCLVVKNECFRRYCQRQAAQVLPAMLEALSMVPTAENKASATAPPSATALLITLLILTGDPDFCKAASAAKVVDARSVLGNARSVRDIQLSSVLVAVLLRIAHWNFGACRDAFFNQAIAGILGNLAGHGIEHVHWHTAGRMLEVAALLARNAVKLPQPTAGATGAGLAEAAELHRARMVRGLLRSLLRLLSSCLRAPRVTTNCALVYALQRDYPAQFTQLEADQELGPPLMHVRTTIDWFEAQCPPNEEVDVGVEAQSARLHQASTRLPQELMTLASVAGASISAYAEVYAETASASAFFLPVVWRAAHALIPEHVCWSQPSASAAKTKS